MLVAGLIIGGTVVGLSIHFTKMPITPARIAQTTSTTTNKPAVKDHVLMLSTDYFLSNVPMVIGLDGESVLQFYFLLHLHIIIVTRILSSMMSHN